MTGPSRSIDPGRAPGLLVTRAHDRAGRLVEEQVLDLANVQEIAERQGDAAAAGVVAAVYIYDGDTGRCLGTLMVD